MKFKEVIGQDDVKERLRRSVSENRVSHAQLFLGDEGCGKLPLAIAYAQYINCKNRTYEDSCGECASCKKYEKLIHPDLHFIYPINKTKEVDSKKITSADFLTFWRELMLEKDGYISLLEWYEKIGIEKQQALINAEDADTINQKLAYKSYEAEYKVMIIWMPEKMNITSANKLLKNLEEPPEKTLFILVSEDKEQIIPTILSRAQLVKIPHLKDEEIQQALIEKYKMPAVEANTLAKCANGNLSHVLLSVNKNKLSSALLEAEKERFTLFREWMRKCYTVMPRLKDYVLLQDIITQLIGDGSREKQKDMLIYGLEMFRLCLQWNIGNSHVVKMPDEEREFIEKFSPFIHPNNIHLLEQEFNKALVHIERNANPNIIFTDLSLLTGQILKMK